MQIVNICGGLSLRDPTGKEVLFIEPNGEVTQYDIDILEKIANVSMNHKNMSNAEFVVWGVATESIGG